MISLHMLQLALNKSMHASDNEEGTNKLQPYITYCNIRELLRLADPKNSYISLEDIASDEKIMKSIKILQHCQQSAAFLNATFSGKHWKLLQINLLKIESVM